MTKQEEREYTDNTVRMINNKFSAHAGIKFVIETNKLLRQEIEQLEIDADYWHNQTVIAQKYITGQQEKIEVLQRLKNVSADQMIKLLKEQRLEAKIKKLKDDVTYWQNRAALLQLQINESCTGTLSTKKH